MTSKGRSGPPLREAAPTGHTTGIHHSADSCDSSLYRPQDGYAAPSAEDRREAGLLAELRDLGYQPATRCTRCGQWVVAAKSVALHMGPVCRAKSAAAAVTE
ncbi:MAG: hypothetical protein QG671_1607 [Actinomycetota bacterium]|nr:hypothetical protein [Actinomycetota bacterium]